VVDKKNVSSVIKQKNSDFSLKKIAILLIGFGLSGIGLWYVFRDIEFDALITSADRIQPVFVVLSMISYWAGAMVLRALLIRHLLAPIGVVKVQAAYRYICIGFLANNVLPLRMGEVARIGGIARVSGIGFATVTGGLTIERMLDLSMAVLIGVAAVQVAPLPTGVQIAVLVTGCALVVGFIGAALIARRVSRESSSSGKLWQYLKKLFNRFSAGFGVLQSFRGIFIAALLAATIWGLVVVAMMLRLSAFDLEPSLPVVLVLLTSISLGVTLPSAPAYVGVYHFAAAGALMLFGIDETLAVSFAVFCHLTDVLPGTIFGFVCMILEGLGFADLRRGRS
jgi:glycosyltransferase 2 family protein